MTKKPSPKAEDLNTPGKPLFVFGLDKQGKPIGARFKEGAISPVIHKASEMKCSMVVHHSPQFDELGMKLPLGRIYSNGRLFVPNIRRDLFDKLRELQKTEGNKDDPKHWNGLGANVSSENDKDARKAIPAVGYTGLPKTWDAIGPGNMVLVQESPEDGWFEALVMEREHDVLTVRLRDYPDYSPMVRHVSTVALVFPNHESK